MHSVDAEGLCYREEYRAENIECGVCVDKAACDNENDVDHQQEGVLISVSDRDKALACVTCKAGKGKNLAEYGCASDDKHDNGSLRNGLAQDNDDLFKAQGLVDEYADYKSVNRRNRSGFGRGENTAVYTAEDDDRHKYAPHGVAKSFPALFAACFRLTNQIAASGADNHGEVNCNANEYAGDDTCHEQVADRGSGYGAVDNKGDRRWDNDTYCARRTHERGACILFIAGFAHCRDKYSAEGRDGSRAGAGNCREEARNNDADHCGAVLCVSYKGVKEVYKSHGYAADVHDVAGENEERDRQQNIGIGGRIEVRRYSGHHSRLDCHRSYDARHAQRHCYGHIQEKKGEEYSK